MRVPLLPSSRTCTPNTTSTLTTAAVASRHHCHHHQPTPPLSTPRPAATLTAALRRQILVREPLGVLTSFARVLQPSHQELGYTALLEVLGELRLAQPGRQPIVVLSGAQPSSLT